MKKLIAIGLVISMVLSIIIVGVSLAKGPPEGAGAAKMPLWNSPGFDDADGATTTDVAYGFVILNTNASGELIVNFVLKGATANADFILYVNRVKGGTIQAPNKISEITNDVGVVLTTNSQGNGNAHFIIPSLDETDWFWVSAIDFDSGQKLRSVAVALD